MPETIEFYQEEIKKCTQYVETHKDQIKNNERYIVDCRRKMGEMRKKEKPEYMYIVPKEKDIIMFDTIINNKIQKAIEMLEERIKEINFVSSFKPTHPTRVKEQSEVEFNKELLKILKGE